MITIEDVKYAYRMILGREPESEAVCEGHLAHQNLAALRSAFIYSCEGMERLSRELTENVEAEGEFVFFRPVIVHLHLEKTGGTALHKALTERGDLHATTPHIGNLKNYSLAWLNRFDLISGHFSYQEAMAIPREPKILFTTFRDPYERLLSFYRFHRTFPDEMREIPVVRLCKDCPPEEFFAHDEIRTSPRFLNYYLRNIGDLPADWQDCTPEVAAAALDRAIERIDRMSAVGVTEDMPASLRLLGAVTGFELPTQLPRAHETDHMHRDYGGYLPVEKFELTPQLRDVHDRAIHDHARTSLYKRLSRLSLAA